MMKRQFQKKTNFNSQEPPSAIVELGEFCHSCQGQMVCTRIPSQSKIPYFNANVYLKNKSQVGRVDEILGPMNELYFTVKTLDGIPATSFTPGDALYISPEKLLPLERFLPRADVVKPLRPSNMQGKLSGNRANNRRSFNGKPRGKRPGEDFKNNMNSFKRGNTFARGRGAGNKFGNSTFNGNKPRNSNFGRANNNRGVAFNKFKGRGRS